MIMRSLSFGTSLATVLLVPVAAQQPLQFAVNGGGAGAEAGRAVAVVGDTDGDRRADVLVGAPTAGAGTATLYSGATGAVLHTFTGANAGDQLGAAVASAGDFDGDGVGDVVVGIPGADQGGTDAGRAQVFSGATGAVLLTVDGVSAGDALGSAVAGVGDVDADGYADVGIGAPGFDLSAAAMDAGRCQIWSGRTATLLHTVTGGAAGDALGSAVAAVGDLDGDCRAEFVVGVPGDDATATDAGAIHVHSGATAAVLWSWQGAVAGDAAGTALSGGADVDGDGAPDVAVGIPGDDTAGIDAGAAAVLSGATGALLWSWTGDAAGDAFGSAVALGHDADGDGRSDALVGAPGHDLGGVGAGLARLFSGASGWPLASYLGTAGDAAGTAVSVGGDTSGDGYGAVLVGVPGDDTAGADAGQARLHGGGPRDGETVVATHSPGIAGTQYGSVIKSVGDIDGDQVPDYMCCGPAPTGFGQVELYSGATHTVIKSWTETQQVGTWFGIDFERAGDIDSDGVMDLIIGVYHYDAVGGSLLDAGRADIYSGANFNLLRSHTGTLFGMHRGTRVGTMGDLDGDGVDDYFISDSDPSASGTGQVVIYSGATGTAIPGLTFVGPLGAWFGWSAANVGDWDGDGKDDLAVGAPSGQTVPIGNGTVTVYSTGTGGVLQTFNGLGTRDLFGWDLAPIGDANADGVPDLIVGAYRHDPNGGAIQDAGMARVFSGKDGSVLHTVFGTDPGDQLGEAVGGIGDYDGDGYDDFAAGATNGLSSGLPTGWVSIYSGFDGRVLQTFTGTLPFDQTRVARGLGDLNGDGLPEIGVGSPGAPGAQQNGRVEVFASQRAADPGDVVVFGAPCAGSAGALPRSEFAGVVKIGAPLLTQLRTAPGLMPGAWAVGAMPTALPLAALGMPGCTLYTTPVISLPIATNSLGKVAFPLVIPANAALVGGQLVSQWAIADPPANTAGVVLSDAGLLTIGR